MSKLLKILFANILLISINIFAQYDSLYHNEIWRTYLTHLPPQYNSNEDKEYPLVLVMHGGFGNAYNIEEQSQFSNKADTAKFPFIVVYPEGVKSPINITTWNAGGCCGYSVNTNINDVDFISTLLDKIVSKYKIDKNRIYASGLSNGGMMSYRLAAELSNRIAAIAPVASVMVNENIFEPVNSIPIIHLHSFWDDSVPIEGGLGDGAANYEYPPLDSVLNIWANINNCIIIDTIFNESGKYLYKTWTNCNDEKNIELYITYDGGHSWPGGTAPRIGADPVSEQINATNLIWDFFLKHPKENPTNINLDEKLISSFELYQNYPNPFNPTTTIKYSIPSFSVISNEVRNLRDFSSQVYQTQLAPRNDNVKITLKVFDILGNQVSTLVNEKQSSGNYEIQFDGKTLPSGIYFYRLQFNNFSKTKSMLLLK
ncbi:MAG: T9SS type A sorting domain-containing protein [Ignavibacteriae bacterium]|nr:T9SS type A sorting domain-containing protein [Ignavibacteriota bacterium]